MAENSAPSSLLLHPPVISAVIPTLEEKKYVDREWLWEPGLHTCLMGAQRAGKTIAMYTIIMEHVRRGRDVYMFSDSSFEILNFFQLDEFKHRVVIHSPAEIEVDPEGQVFDEETRKLIHNSIVYHPPVDPDRAMKILKWRKRKKKDEPPSTTRIDGRIHAILDTGLLRFEKESDRVKCVHTFLKLVLQEGVTDIVIAVDEASWLFPTTMSSLFKGHISEAAGINEITGKLAKYRDTLLLSTQSLKGMSLSAFRNVFQYLVFRNIDPATAEFLERQTNGVLPYLWQWARQLPDPKLVGYSSSIFINTSKGEAGTIRFQKDFRWPPAPFRKIENGVKVPGLPPIVVRIVSPIVVESRKKLRDLMLGKLILMLKNEGHSLTEIHQSLIDDGIKVTKRTIYRIVKEHEAYMKTVKGAVITPSVKEKEEKSEEQEMEAKEEPGKDELEDYS